MSFQSISDLNGAIASLADWGQKISREFFEIKMNKVRKSLKHKGLVSNPCSKSAPRQGFVGILPENLKMSTLQHFQEYRTTQQCFIRFYLQKCNAPTCSIIFHYRTSKFIG